MSIFGNIVSKLFHHAPAAPEQTASAAAPAADTSSATPAPSAPAAEIPSAAPAASASAAPAAAPASAATAPSTAGKTVDVAAVMDGLAAKDAQKLDWRHSIVDMMKLLDLDSSLSSRKELAHELSYSGDTNDSASMNIWLHGQVMKKLAENGGVVPADLKG